MDARAASPSFTFILHRSCGDLCVAIKVVASGCQLKPKFVLSRNNFTKHLPAVVGKSSKREMQQTM